MLNDGSIARKNVTLEMQLPIKVSVIDGCLHLDFGAVAFGNLRISGVLPQCTLTVHFGEKQVGEKIDRKPPGSVRYGAVEVNIHANSLETIVSPPNDARNTGEAAVKMPAEWGAVAPFRWIEIEGWPPTVEPVADLFTRRAAFPRDWRDEASDFRCDDECLTKLWQLCKYTMKATAFAGVFVDGDRERIPYEADAYLNQIGYFATSGATEIARDTFDYLMSSPTWPTEWASHMIFMAHADWMHTGDVYWLSQRLPGLRSKLHLDRIRSDGLISSTVDQMKADIVDWPRGERDGFIHSAMNSVVNAFFIRALGLYCDLCNIVGLKDGMEEVRKILDDATHSFDKIFWNEGVGLYRDGESIDHYSSHANLFPVAFDIANPSNVEKIVRYLVEKGMVCSVYASQYLLEALFKSGRDSEALDLMLAPGDRSWRHMLRSGTTLTWEAWDQRYKPNQDWNHAWGAAPANLLPRYLGGVTPKSPGWETVLIQPRPAGRTNCHCRVPTPLGAVEVEWFQREGFHLNVLAPEAMQVSICVPATGAQSVWIGDERIENIQPVDGYVSIPALLRGEITVSVRN